MKIKRKIIKKIIFSQDSSLDVTESECLLIYIPSGDSAVNGQKDFHAKGNTEQNILPLK